jgi:hypothetical protein
MKLGVFQLIFEIFIESITTFISGDSKLLIIKWIPENGSPITQHITFMMSQVDYLSCHLYEKAVTIIRL